jgi:hypothetical protein
MKTAKNKTKVKFLLDKDANEVFAYFPQLNYSKPIYGNTMKMGYAHIGQHTGVHIEYARECKKARENEYLSLANELKQIGYNLQILNK